MDFPHPYSPRTIRKILGPGDDITEQNDWTTHEWHDTENNRTTHGWRDTEHNRTTHEWRDTENNRTTYGWRDADEQQREMMHILKTYDGNEVRFL